MVSRSEGYRLSVGKEEMSLQRAAGFFRRVVALELDRIENADENYLLGDFRTASGWTIECKGQPIDPVRYPQNFVEVFEVTTVTRHMGGFSNLANLLGLTPAALAAVTFEDRRRNHTSAGGTLGRLPYVSVSIRSIAGSALTIYVNPAAGHVYVYRSLELIEHVITAVGAGGLRRGMGRSNEATFAVQVPLAAWRWSVDALDDWQYRGSGAELEAVDAIKSIPGPRHDSKADSV